MSFVTIHKYILRVSASVLNSLLQRLLDLARRVNWSSHCSPPPPSWNWLALHFVPPRRDTPQILRRRRERVLKRPAIPEIEHFKLFYDAISTGVTEFWSPVNQSFLQHDACDDITTMMLILMMLILMIMMVIMLTWRCTKAIVCNSKMFVSPTHHVKIYLGDRFFIHLHLSVVCAGHNLFWSAEKESINLLSLK